MKDYLLDTNILIYYFGNSIPYRELDKVENIFNSSFNIDLMV